nr:retrovirus-related Pol polyprotein from transposon TNT 1-94 [Tanacetum cinerariifolium]
MFLGTVRFGNDHVAPILGFSDLQWGNILIARVYFVEGLSHNLFSVGQFYDSDLEVAFRKDACFVRNLEGVDLLKGDRLTNLYTINLNEMASASPICVMARTSSTKSWLWHQRLSHLNFKTINDLARYDLVAGLPKFKYHKEHLCPSCEQGKSKRASHPPKPVLNSRQRLHLLHMDLCGPMRISSINEKRYVLVIVDDYSRYTWVHFLRSKDEAPEHKILELEIERLLKAVVSQDIISVVQNASVVVPSDLQTELERTKERFENCIIKKETEYAKLWNDWYKKCDEYKYDKISYDKAYKDMQQKIERLQAQLGNLKGKSKDTSSVSDTRNPLSQKLKNKNVELEFQDLSANTKFAKQQIVENIPKFGKTNALSKPVTSNSVSTPQEPKSVNNDKVIAPGMFRICPDKVSREAKKVPNTVSASARTKLISVSQPPVITKKNVNSDVNGLSSTGVDNTKTRRPQPRRNTKNDRVPSASKSSQNKNKEAEVEEHHRNLLLSKNNKYISSACNNFKIDSQDVISKVVCAMCKK